MNRRWIYGSTAGVLLAFTLAATYALPYLTVWRLREAAAMRDDEAIARCVDFERLRGNVQSSLAASLAREAPSGRQAGTFGRRLATAMVRSVVDVVVTPKGIGMLMRGEVPIAQTASDGDSTLSPAEMGYEDASTFVVTMDLGNPEQHVDLILERNGLTWKLSDVRLPL